VIALPVAAGAEGAGTADSIVSRYSGLCSTRNAEESHAKKLANARRPGESASSESGAEARGDPPAACRERSERTGRGLTLLEHNTRRGREHQPSCGAANARGARGVR
jgi:hypothetical protein